MTPAAVLSILVKAQGVAVATRQLGQLDAAGKKAGDSAERAAAKHQKAGQAIATASKVGVVAVGALAAGAVKMAANYQQSMNTLQAVSGATGEEMKKLSKLAVKLGADVKLPGTSAQDAAEAMTEMIKAGVSLKDTMGGVRDVLVLSAAAGVSNARAAEIASNALNSFKLEGKDVKKVTDELANTANASSVEIEDVADAFAMASAVFAGFQKPAIGAKNAMTELNVAIGILGNAGIKGSDAGTSLKQTLLQLTGPSNKAKDAMKALFIAAMDNTASEKDVAAAVRGSTKERGEALKRLIAHNKALGGSADIAYDAAGKMRSLKDVIALVAKGTAKMTQEEKNAYLTQIFGADATRSVIALMNAGPKGFDKMTAAVQKQGAAQALATAKMKGFNGAVEAFKSTIETLAISFGTVLLPPLTKFLQILASAAPILEENKTLVLAVAAAVAVLAAGTLALNAALAINPYVLAVAGLVALGVWLVKTYQSSEKFRNAVDAAFGALKVGAGAMRDAVAAAFQWVVTAFNNAVHWVGIAMDNIVKEIHKWDVAAAVVKAAITAIKVLLAPGLAAINMVVKVAMTEIPIVFRTVWGVVKAELTGAWTAIKGIVTGGLQAVRGVIKIIGGLFKGDFGQVWDGIKDVFKGALKALAGIVKGAAQILGGAAEAIGKGIADGVIKGLGQLGHMILDKFKDAAGFVKDKIGDLFSGIGGLISGGSGDGIGKALAGGGGRLPAGGAFGGSLMGAQTALRPFAAIGSRFGLSVSSGRRPGAITSSGNVSYHSTGEAIDEAGTPAGMLAFFKYMKGHFGGRLAELIYTPGGIGIKDGRPFRYTGQVAADHFDHVHVALDTGRPGVGDGLGRLYAAGARAGDGIGQIKALWTQAGGSAAAQNMAAAIAMAESGGNPNVSHRNSDGSIDRGLWQINSVHGSLSTFNRLGNAKAAVKISGNGRNWNPWSVFKSGAYKRFLTSAKNSPAAKGGTKAKGGGTVTVKPSGSGVDILPSYNPGDGLSPEQQAALAFTNARRGPAKGTAARAPLKGLTPEQQDAIAANQGDQEDPNQPLIDAQNAAKEAADRLREQVEGLRTDIQAQTAFATSVANTSNFQLTKDLADLLSGRIAGYGLAGRRFTAGTGVEVSY